MGTKIIVGTQVMRVIKDELLPNAIKTGSIKAIMKDGSMPTYITEELLNSIGFKADQVYDYAAKGKYLYGLPSAYLRSNTQGYSKVQTVLNSLEGRAVILDYTRLSAANFLHLGWMTLASQYGYRADTNELTVLSAQEGLPVYLSDMQVCVPANKLEAYKYGVLDIVGLPPNAGYSPERVSAIAGSSSSGSLRKGTPVYADTMASVEYLKITTSRLYNQTHQEGSTVWMAGTIRLKTFNITMPTVPDPDKEYFHAKYIVNGTTKWWLYQIGAGTYPTLDAIATAGSNVSGKFFPFSYFRYEKASEVDNKNTESYKSTKTMLKMLGLDYDEIGETINENPDIKDVIQAYLMFGVSADTEDQDELKYIYDFFDQLYNAQGADNTNTSQTTALTAEQLATQNILTDGRNKISLNIADTRFRMNLSASGLYKQACGGNIGEVGSYKSTTGQIKYKIPYIDSEDGLWHERAVSVPYYSYQYQITEGIYAEIQVYELEMQYYVYGTKYTTSDTTKNILLIPIDKSLVEDYSIIKKENLYSRSLHFVFNSMQIIKVKWYQTGIFSFLMVVVAIVITVFTAGSGGGIAAALASGSVAALQAAVLSLFLDVLIGFATSMAISLVAKAVGGDLAILLAAVAIAIASYQVFEYGSISGAPWAKDLISIANNLYKAGISEKMDDLLKDYSAFSEWRDSALETLEAANKLLENNTHLSPMLVFGETPDDFYNRTVHSGNIGVLGIGAISSYVDIALTLPKFNDTVGEGIYGV